MAFVCSKLQNQQVPIIDRRARKLVSAKSLSRAQRNKLPPQSMDYPPEKPACLRGHTPTTIGPSEDRVIPKRSVRGPRGRKNIESGAFNKPGVLGGLSVSPWVEEEEAERAKRVVSHKAAISKVRASLLDVGFACRPHHAPVAGHMVETMNCEWMRAKGRVAAHLAQHGLPCDAFLWPFFGRRTQRYFGESGKKVGSWTMPRKRTP